ncbi:VasL domain-containing protein [Enterobacteriaceae bacterium LUAb1]
MTMQPLHTLRLAHDLRTQAEFIALRNEMAKLTHPARPDVDWVRAEKLALTVFQQHGVELQSVSWYTLIRSHRNGLAGMQEGLELLAALLNHQWPLLWPQQTHARLTLLSHLGNQLQQRLRSESLQYSDLTILYGLEKTLQSMITVLEKLELRHLSQLDGLATQVASAARRLEQLQDDIVIPAKEMTGHDNFSTDSARALSAMTPVPPVTTSPAGEPLVWVMRETLSPPAPPPPGHWQRVRGFVAGMLTALVLGGAALIAWQHFTAPPPVSRTQQLAALAWQLRPEGARLPLPENWRQAMAADAFPQAQLTEWQLAQQRLQILADRLNALDGKRSGYLTVSELKSAVFGIQQPLNAVPPTEELLRQYQADPTPASQAAVSQRLRQLLNYYLLMQEKE